MSEAAIARAAKYGDAYHPLWTTPEVLAEKVKKLRSMGSKIPVSLRMPVDMHRNRTVVVRTSGTKMQQIAGSADMILAQITRYVDAGMDHLLVEFDVEDAATLKDDIRLFAKEIMNSLS